MTPDLDKAKPWPLFGYAPGGYMCRCADCGKQFDGDKRAVQCLECAALAAADLIASHRALEEQNAALAKGQVALFRQACDATFNGTQGEMLALLRADREEARATSAEAARDRAEFLLALVMAASERKWPGVNATEEAWAVERLEGALESAYESPRKSDVRIVLNALWIAEHECLAMITRAQSAEASLAVAKGALEKADRDMLQMHDWIAEETRDTSRISTAANMIGDIRQALDDLKGEGNQEFSPSVAGVQAAPDGATEKRHPAARERGDEWWEAAAATADRLHHLLCNAIGRGETVDAEMIDRLTTLVSARPVITEADRAWAQAVAQHPLVRAGLLANPPAESNASSRAEGSAGNLPPDDPISSDPASSAEGES
jgi:hypothetical protein